MSEPLSQNALADLHLSWCAVDAILPLRQRVLRAGFTLDESRFDADAHEHTRHLAAWAPQPDRDAELIGCLSLMPSTWSEQFAWQLRGMAVAEGWRGRGVGQRLVGFASASLREHGESIRMWCNARVPAQGFYARMGWQTVSEEFEIPTAGPHVRMVNAVLAQASIDGNGSG